MIEATLAPPPVSVAQDKQTPLAKEEAAVQVESSINTSAAGFVGEATSSTEQINHSPELAKQEPKIQNDSVPKPLSSWDQFREKFYNGPSWFQAFREYFTLGLNGIGILFNTVAVIATNSKIFKKQTAEAIDKVSEWFSKYIIPFSFTWNGVEALFGNRAVEALVRIVPAIAFCFLPFHNLNLATGVSSGLQYLFEHVKDRHGGEHPAPESMSENAKIVFKTSLEIIKDIFKGNTKHEDFPKQIATVCMLTGSIGGFIFSPKDRDTLTARFLGNLRNIGGIIADWKLIFNDVKDDLRRAWDLRLVGSLCSSASLLNILMRWVNPELARSLNHISIALDDMGLTYWAQSSKRDNDKARAQASQLAMAA